jgi:hypothetical protein
MDELACSFVGSFGLLKSVSHRSPIPISDFDGLDPNWYSSLYSGCVLHVCPQALPSFVSKVLPSISVPFKLLTNNSDKTLPTDYSAECSTILGNPLLIKWFSQNWETEHEKVERIPIGMDYHSLKPSGKPRFTWSQPEKGSWGIKKIASEQENDLLSLKYSSPHFSHKQLKAYANFQFLMWTRYGKIDRKDALEKVPKHLVFYEPVKTTRDVCWRNMASCAFVLSPQGNGLDCHRTWEALCMGCIPIVKSCGLNPLFDDLPVWIVNDWTEVTEENMRKVLEDFKSKSFNYEKLTLKYWQTKINGV